MAVGGKNEWECRDGVRCCREQVRYGSWVQLILCSRKVSYEEGSKFAKDNGLVFMEVSAKTAYQVEDAFKKNAENLL